MPPRATQVENAPLNCQPILLARRFTNAFFHFSDFSCRQNGKSGINRLGENGDNCFSRVIFLCWCVSFVVKVRFFVWLRGPYAYSAFRLKGLCASPDG